MAITHVLGKPSLFIAFTANPSWPEIQQNLEHSQTPDTRPDILAIVFKLKLDPFLRDIKELDIFGKCISSVYTIEYQKRGLLHAHILLYLHQDDIPRCAEMVDELVRARLPKDDPELASFVKKQLTHGPCGPEFHNAPWSIHKLQAVWRLFGYTAHEEKPAVLLLPFHLEGKHRVSFAAELSAEQIAEAVEIQSSPFIVWMAYNAAKSDGQDLIYSDFPLF
ncbi:hypothetical protein EPUL_000100 [Erysiphe pulchra]|uniref:Helitron helicase-like domain-containing protein n=1 Tax=Erysiphe pulchra TaxID=225359 RepID=A0A2S4Q289_9PEZI|nr:hypothetical protein EPUL_000100 [Erysiphe pulchra]